MEPLIEETDKPVPLPPAGWHVWLMRWSLLLAAACIFMVVTAFVYPPLQSPDPQLLAIIGPEYFETPDEHYSVPNGVDGIISGMYDDVVPGSPLVMAGIGLCVAGLATWRMKPWRLLLRL